MQVESPVNKDPDHERDIQAQAGTSNGTQEREDTQSVVSLQGPQMNTLSTFDQFVSLAFSTILTLLLAWRFLVYPAQIEDSESDSDRERHSNRHFAKYANSDMNLVESTSTSATEPVQDNTTQASSSYGWPCAVSTSSSMSMTSASHSAVDSQPTALSISQSPFTQHPAPNTIPNHNSNLNAKSLVSASSSSYRPLGLSSKVNDSTAVEDEVMDDESLEQVSSAQLERTSLNSVRQMLSCEPAIQTQPVSRASLIGNAAAHIVTLADDDHEMSPTSSISGGEHPNMAAYLDTITEEDTDDLLSLSSTRSPSPGKLFYPLAVKLSASGTNVRRQVLPDTKPAQPRAHQSLIDNDSDKDTVHADSRDSTPQRALPMPETEPEPAVTMAPSPTHSSSSCSSSAPRVDRRTNGLETSVSDENYEGDNEQTQTQTQATSQHARTTTSTSNIDCNQSNMDIDLERAMRRFARYGQVYSDAAESGMDEFKPEQNNPTPTSSVHTPTTPTINGHHHMNGHTSLSHAPMNHSSTTRTVNQRIDWATTVTETETETVLTYTERRLDGTQSAASAAASTQILDLSQTSRSKSSASPVSNRSSNDNERLAPSPPLPTPPPPPAPVESPPRPPITDPLPAPPKQNEQRTVITATSSSHRTDFATVSVPRKIEPQLPTLVPAKQAPGYFGSSDHLHQMLDFSTTTRKEDEPNASTSNHSQNQSLSKDKDRFGSSEHLHQLLNQSLPQTQLNDQSNYQPPSAEKNSQKLDKKKDFFGSSEHLHKSLPQTQLSDMVDSEPVQSRSRGEQPFEYDNPFASASQATPKSNLESSKKDFFGSSGHLHQLLETGPVMRTQKTEAPTESEADRRRKAVLFASSEHLQMMIQAKDSQLAPPLDDRSKLSALSTENLTAWNSLPENTKDGAREQLHRYQDSMQPAGGSGFQRTYQGYKTNEERSDDAFSRSSKRASSRYRQKIEKARNDFLTKPANGSASDLTKEAKDFEQKHKVSIDDIRRPKPPLRGPLLEKFHSKEWNSKIDLTELPQSDLYGRQRPSATDLEYERISAQAKALWSSYRQKAGGDMSTKSKSFSTTQLNYQTPVVDQQGESTDRSFERARSVTAHDQQNDTRNSRPRDRDSDSAAPVSAHYRAKSVDFLMDQQAREATAPPENQLKKLMNDSDTNTDQVTDRQLSEHELRFQKSLEALRVPDWYVNSGMAGHKYAGTEANTPSTQYTATPLQTPQTPIMSSMSDAYVPLADRVQPQAYGRPQAQPAPYIMSKAPMAYSGGVQQASLKYKSPWIGGRITDRSTASVRKPVAPDSVDFSGLFGKYKTEIEELRHSRESLHDQAVYERTRTMHTQQHGYTSASGLPVAAVKPRPYGHEYASSTMSSTTHTPKPNKPPVPMRSNNSFSQGGFATSTPRHSAELPRTQQPPAPFNYDLVPPMSSSVTTRRYAADQTTAPASVPAPVPAVTQHPGWIVARPAENSQPNKRDSRVIEVADMFVGPRRVVDAQGNVVSRYGGRATLEEVLDSVLALPAEQRRLSALDESSHSPDVSHVDIQPRTPEAATGPNIFTQNYLLMEQSAKNPDNADEILKNELLFVRCAYCQRIKQLNEARFKFVTCKHCYTYYCGRQCRGNDWPRHKTMCTFARVNTTCKQIILKVRDDSEAQWYMSRVARECYANRGRGSVNFRLPSLEHAEAYIEGGWPQLMSFEGNFLYYYTVPDLIDNQRDPALVALCRRYNPESKLILSVSIVADIEQCPSTPPPPQTRPVSAASNPSYMPVPPRTPEPVSLAGSLHDLSFAMSSRPTTPTNLQPLGDTPNYFRRTSSLPDYKKQTVKKRAERMLAQNQQLDSRQVLQSVLRSLENIAPGQPQNIRSSRDNLYIQGDPNRPLQNGPVNPAPHTNYVHPSSQIV